MNNDKITDIPTRVRTGRGILGETAKHVAAVFDKGNVAVISAKNVDEYGQIAVKSLISEGYTVKSITIDDTVALEKCRVDIPEYVRFVLGVGGGKIADVTRLAAQANSAKYGLIATAPSTESYLSDKVLNDGGGRIITTGFPEILLIDYDVADDCPSDRIAAGYGRVIAQLTNIFDAEFSGLITGVKYDADALSGLADTVRNFELGKESGDMRTRLFDALINIAEYNHRLPFGNTAVDGFARILSQNLGRSEGETSFLASYIVLNVYRAYLSAAAVDTMLPADTVKSVKLLEKMRAINYNDYISATYALSAGGYLKQSFVLNEYRKELFGKLEGLDLTVLAKYWRRLYDDAGYWLKNYATGAALLRYLSIAAEISENCLLKYIKRTGFLEKFV